MGEWLRKVGNLADTPQMSNRGATYRGIRHTGKLPDVKNPKSALPSPG